MKTKRSTIDISHWDIAEFRVRDYTPDDMEVLDELGALRATSPEMQIIHKFGPAFVVETPGGPLLAGGMVEHHKGVGMAWCSVTRLIEVYPRETYYYSRVLLDECIKRLRVRAVMCYAEINQTVIRFAERMGFEPKCALPQWFEDETYCMMYQVVSE